MPVKDFPQPSESLLRKLALYMHMQQQQANAPWNADTFADRSMLDDLELNGWLERMTKQGLLVNDRYTRKRMVRK